MRRLTRSLPFNLHFICHLFPPPLYWRSTSLQAMSPWASLVLSPDMHILSLRPRYHLNLLTELTRICLLGIVVCSVSGLDIISYHPSEVRVTSLFISHPQHLMLLLNFIRLTFPFHPMNSLHFDNSAETSRPCLTSRKSELWTHSQDCCTENWVA